MSRYILAIAAISGLLTPAAPILADDPQGRDEVEAKARQELAETIRTHLLRELGSKEEPFSDNWDHKATVQVPDGVKVQGFQVTVRTRQEQVNDGLWIKGGVRLSDPDQNLAVEIQEIHTRVNHLELSGVISGELFCHAKLIEWALGVKLFDVNVEARQGVRIEIGAQLDVQDDGRFIARIVRSDVQPGTFRVQRIGAVRGKTAEEIGQLIKGLVDRVRPDLMRSLMARAEEALGRVKLEGDLAGLIK